MANQTNQTTQRSGGIGFLGLLAILFIGLKLTGYITWSWWWVLAPLWIPVAIVFGALSFMFIGMLIAAIASNR